MNALPRKRADRRRPVVVRRPLGLIREITVEPTTRRGFQFFHTSGAIGFGGFFARGAEAPGLNISRS